jgi:hypothetical protein
MGQIKQTKFDLAPSIKRGVPSVGFKVRQTTFWRLPMEASIGEVLVSIIAQFEIGEFETFLNPLLEDKPHGIDDLPFIGKAREWGVTVKIVPTLRKRLGHYDKDRREILLVSLDAQTFLHELGHVAIESLGGAITHTQLQWMEVMAELAALALCHLVIGKPDQGLRSAYYHIFLNAVVLGMSPVEACIEVFHETEHIIKHILE